jgi:serine/threonine protein phosphatase PrpC
MGITALQLHKRSSYEYKYIQDKYCVNSNGQSFALADGTTQSFNSELWADIITRDFIDHPSFEPSQLIELFTKSINKYRSVDFRLSTNPARASLEKAKQKKGGTATFMGMRFLSKETIEVIVCGDTNLFIWNKKGETFYFPFSNIDSLDSNNCFVNTEQLLQGEIDESFFKKQVIELQRGDKIILATDALSRLLLKRPELKDELLEHNNFMSFHTFCTKYWDNKELEEDDISAIVIDTEKENSLLEIVPPPDFSFPKEKETNFIPTPKSNIRPSKYSPMEMNEIQNQFNGVAHDFHLVKRRLNLHGMLLVIAIMLLMANLMTLLWFSPLRQKNATKVIKAPTEIIIKKKQKSSDSKTEKKIPENESVNPVESKKAVTTNIEQVDKEVISSEIARDQKVIKIEVSS